MGFEADARKNLGFIDPLLNTNLFDRFFAVANVMIGKSELLIDTSITVNQHRKSSFQGQSDYVVNVGLFYQNDTNGIQSSLLFNTFGPRMLALGQTVSGGESIGELPFHSLDFLISKTFKKHYMLSVGVQNLLDSKVTLVKDVNFNNKFEKSEPVYKSYAPGRYVTIGLKVKF
jgi:outer membrane receptor protein involved in Fe transport